MKNISMLVLFVFMTACTMAVPRHQVPALTFLHLDSIKLSADQVLFSNDVPSPVFSTFDPPENEPAKATLRMLHRRYAANQEHARTIRFTVREAIIQTQEEGKTKSFQARLAVMIDMEDPNTTMQQGSLVTVRHATEFESGISLAAQDRVKFRVLETALNHLDTALQNKLQEFGVIAD